MEKDTLSKNGELAIHKHIVGIGASAGGMDAIHRLFDHMPANTGFSFVVIQHLSPDHKSLLSELLAKHTKMKVVEATDGMLREPDYIYVIPSGKIMTIQNHCLRLREKVKSRSQNETIDIFFNSLAKDQGSKAIGIILSGTGTDGSKGLVSIRKAGGISIVQEPETAAFDGMPLSAAEAVSPDIIAPPEMIGQELLDLLKEPALIKSLSSMKEEDENLLLEILDMLHKSTRYDFSHYRRPTLFRRLSKRMSELSISQLSEYKDYLSQNDSELKKLSREFLINVTRFFRDPEAFEALRTEVIPSIFSNRKPEDPIKVWVVACSSGEEAYSIAILFLEYARKSEAKAPNIKIFATDIDSDALEIASRGIYSHDIEKYVPAPMLSRYFVREGNHFRVGTELRKLIVFANHDVTKDPPFSRLDLITCRNMFIYMNNILQERALRKFHFALKVNSYLMIGPSENVGVLKEVTQEVSRKWKIYRCTTKDLGDSDTIFVPLENTVAAKLPSTRKDQGLNLTEILKETLLEDRKVALILIDKEFNVKQAIGSYKSFLQLPEGNFDFNILKFVHQDLAVALGVSIRKAIAGNCKHVMKNVVLHDNQETPIVNIIVKPYLERSTHPRAFLSIVIEEGEAHLKPLMSFAEPLSTDGEQVAALKMELLETRQNLQAVIEEMEAVNEELQSSNEEMISTNEELQSTNEELQSLNEELHTVSAEHQLKIKELFELNDDLNNYFNNSDIGQILVDPSLVIRRFSPASKKIINLIGADIGRPLNDIRSNLKDINFAEEVNRVVLSGKKIEKEVQTIDDSYYLMRITPFVRRDKSTDGVVINFVNISQSKQLNGIIEGVFKSSPNGIIAKKVIRDKQNRIVDFECLAANVAAEKMFGVSPGTLVSDRLQATLSASTTQEYLNIYRRVVETGQTEKIEFYDSRTTKWYETTIVKMLDGIVTTHSDITDRKKSADVIAKNYEDLKRASEKLSEINGQLERSNFDLMQFASVASHDLKEPLRKIQAFGNLLQAKIKDKLSEGELNYFTKIVTASNRMQALIDDVLTLSKLSNGNSMRVRTDLNLVIKQIVEDLEITIREKNAEIKVSKLHSIDAVPGQMHQVFQNLISNALKFSDKKSPVITIGQVPVSAQHAERHGINDQYVHISVSDNGIGFENEYKEKIFGIFQRLHGRNYEGTGIGLAIARKIIENHGGFIFADGEVNQGATFHIYLPASSNQATDAKRIIAHATEYGSPDN
jgi:two-component system CheB/CheR fusion protein